MAIKIVIDPGHGGYDNGASYNGRREKDDVLTLGLKVGEILEKMGYDVYYTRTTDVYDSPVQKARIANELNADYFVSIHRNSSPNSNQYNGVQTLIYNDSGIKKIMAENINNQLEEIGFRNINVDIRPDLAVLRRTRMPAVLVEAGFINSDIDNKLFDERLDDIAKAIADGINETIISSNMAIANSMSNYRAENGTKQMDFSYEIENAVTNDNNDDEENVNVENINGENEDIDKAEVKLDKQRNCTYSILIGLFKSLGAANYYLNYLIDDGYNGEVYERDGLFQVQIGEFDNVDEAYDYQKELREKGYETLIICS